jgi:phosphatidylglycerophosphatase GEP4
MDYFRSKPDSQVTKPEQVAIVGDRLFTDMMMANMMGAHSVWVRDGVIEDRNIVSVLSASFRLGYLKTSQTTNPSTFS